MNQLAVKTKIFPIEAEGDLELCNGQPGSAFAKWLKEILENSGRQCDELLQEDYGWGFWMNSNDLTIWVAISFAGEEEFSGSDGEIPTWVLSSNYEDPLASLLPWKWGKRKLGKQLSGEVFEQIKRAVDDNPEIEILENYL